MHTLNNSHATRMSERFRGFFPVVVDVETGGFDAERDALLEIAVVTLSMNNEGLLRPRPAVHAHVEPFAGANIDPRALEITGIDRSPEEISSALASAGDCTKAPTEPPRLLMSARVAALVLAGARPRLTQMPPCCEARVCRAIKVTCLSPFRLALLVKPPKTLSCQARVNHFLELASANFLNCHGGAAI